MAIRVALVGLSARSNSSWAASAHLPYLLSAQGRGRYEIVALLNSSEAAAHSAIAHFHLPAATRAFGNADALADAVVQEDLAELVVVMTRVDVHYPAVLPVLRAAVAHNKALRLLVEWPLAENAGHARTLAALADAAAPVAPLRTTVVLQGRLSPAYAAVRELLRAGRIGRVLSSEALAFGGTIVGGTLPERLSHFVDRKIGGNAYTIGFGHLVDSIQSVLGEIVDARTQFQLQRPDIPLLRADGTTTRSVRSTVPDLITVAGCLAPSDLLHAAGATLLVRLRCGPPFPGEPHYVWTVVGEGGEIRLTSPAGPGLQATAAEDSGPSAVTIELHDFSTDSVTAVPWSWKAAVPQGAWLAALPLASRTLALLYEAIAAGAEEKCVSFAEASRRHDQLDGWLAPWEQ